MSVNLETEILVIPRKRIEVFLNQIAGKPLTEYHKGWEDAYKGLFTLNDHSLIYGEKRQAIAKDRANLRKKIEALGTLEIRHDNTGVMISKSAVLSLLGGEKAE